MSNSGYTSKQLLLDAEDLINKINNETDENKINQFDRCLKSVQEWLIAKERASNRRLQSEIPNNH